MKSYLQFLVRECCDRGAVLLAVALMVAGCQSSPGDGSPDACAPSCDERQCGDDGCGGLCGECPEASLCNSEGQCVADEDDAVCQETCESLGWECGEACGESCGVCNGEQEQCVEHQCKCLQSCDVFTCLSDDGCGGQCGPCANELNCEACPLQLSVVDQVVVDGLVSEVTLAVDYLPGEGSPLPTIADIRLAVSGPVRLAQVGVGAPVTDAEKSLFTSSDTGKPFLILDEGVHQILVFSTGNTKPIESGRWLLLRFVMGPQSADQATNWTAEPGVFTLVKREETLAPPGADATLWGGGYDVPVVVWAQASEVNDEQ